MYKTIWRICFDSKEADEESRQKGIGGEVEENTNFLMLLCG